MNKIKQYKGTMAYSFVLIFIFLMVATILFFTREKAIYFQIPRSLPVIVFCIISSILLFLQFLKRKYVLTIIENQLIIKEKNKILVNININDIEQLKIKESIATFEYTASKSLIILTNKYELNISDTVFAKLDEIIKTLKDEYKVIDKHSSYKRRKKITITADNAFIPLIYSFSIALVIFIYTEQSFNKLNKLNQSKTIINATLLKNANIQNGEYTKQGIFFKILNDKSIYFLHKNNYSYEEKYYLEELLSKGKNVTLQISKNDYYTKMLKIKEPIFITKHFNYNEIEVYGFACESEIIVAYEFD